MRKRLGTWNLIRNWKSEPDKGPETGLDGPGPRRGTVNRNWTGYWNLNWTLTGFGKRKGTDPGLKRTGRTKRDKDRTVRIGTRRCSII